MSFLFFLPRNWIVLFFHNSNSNRLIYSGVLQSAKCFACLRWLYSKIAKSSPPLLSSRWPIAWSAWLGSRTLRTSNRIDNLRRKTILTWHSSEGGEFFRASLFAWYLQYKAQCDDLLIDILTHCVRCHLHCRWHFYRRNIREEVSKLFKSPLSQTEMNLANHLCLVKTDKTEWMLRLIWVLTRRSAF